MKLHTGGSPRPFFEDPIAIGSFHAMKKGVFVSCSGGNSGPQLMTVENVAPWLLTVAASSIDRQFKAAVKLGNGIRVSVSPNTPSLLSYRGADPVQYQMVQVGSFVDILPGSQQ